MQSFAVYWPVGAYGTTASDNEERNALRQPAFHGQAPFFATPLDTNSLTITATQETMNAEIAFANAMNLTGFAILRYLNVSAGLGEGAVSLFKASTAKGALKFVSMEQNGSLGTSATYTNANMVPRLVTEMGLAYYGKVTVSGVQRPLVLYYYESHSLAANYTNLAGLAAVISELRSQAASASLADPYIVVLHYDPATANTVKTAIGANAISSYVPARAYDLNGPYASLRTAAQAHWAAQLATTSKMMPTAITGWSPAARIMRPMSWENQFTGEGHLRIFAKPTPAQLAAHLGEAQAFITANSAACEGGACIIYALNENSEAGFGLCPTLDDPEGAWIDEVAAVLGA